MTRFSTAALLVVLSLAQTTDALSTQQFNRRAVVGWIASSAAAATVVVSLPQASNAVEGFNVDDFLKSGQVAMPMGVAGQAGKSRPETGVVLRDGSEVSRDSRTGTVAAEIVVNGGSDSSKVAVLASYSSPWPLGKF